MRRIVGTPAVSIIVPIYNVEKYLHRCLDTIQNQTLENIEIILVDDESPDACPVICDDAASKDNRIKVIHKKNQGLGLARNSGLEIATGEYVYFVDSDDYLDLHAAEKLYIAAKKENLDLCFAGIYSVDENGNVKQNESIYAGYSFSQLEIISKVLRGMLGAEPNAKTDASVRMSAWQGIYRREWIEDNHLRFPSEREFISEDIIFHLDALPKAKSLRYLKECLYYHIVDNPNSLTHKYNPKRFNKVTILYEEERRIIKGISHNDGMLINAQRMYLGNVRVCLKQIVMKSKTEGKQFAITQINEIINNPVLRTVLQEYPYMKNPIKQAVMSFLLKNYMKYSVYYVTKLFLLK